jgi:hypothetical protein
VGRSGESGIDVARWFYSRVRYDSVSIEEKNFSYATARTFIEPLDNVAIPRASLVAFLALLAAGGALAFTPARATKTAIVITLLGATAGVVSLDVYMLVEPTIYPFVPSGPWDDYVSSTGLALRLGATALAWLLATIAAALIILERPWGRRLAWTLVALTLAAAVYPESKLGWALRAEAALVALALALELRHRLDPESPVCLSLQRPDNF